MCVKLANENIHHNYIEDKMKKTIMLLTGLFLLSYLTIEAQPKMQNTQFGNMGRIKKALKLTPDQEKKFEDIKYKQQQEIIDIHAKIQKNRLDLKKMLTDNKVDQNTVLQLVDDNSKLQGEVKHAVAKGALDIYNILNDDQKPIWAKIMLRIGAGMQMKHKFAAGMARGMMRGHGMMNGQKPHIAPDAGK